MHTFFDVFKDKVSFLTIVVHSVTARTTLLKTQNNMKITKHFSFEEMTRTDTGIANPITTEATVNLVYLCRKLELVRAKFKQPIRINSAYRCPEVNSAVGGVTNSLHLVGRACDINISNLSINDVDTLYYLLEDTSPTELETNLSRGYIHYAI